MFEMIEQLKQTLPIHLYGLGEAKPFSRLLDEIKAGETQIIWENYQPIRVIQVARVYVCHGNQKLVEVKQTIKGQGDRIRGIDCISEKFKLDESAINAACRGLDEELNISVGYKDLKSLGKTSQTKESPSYPGLTTRYEFYDFRWDMPETYYKPDGYIADEGDCVTYFEWVQQ